MRLRFLHRSYVKFMQFKIGLLIVSQHSQWHNSPELFFTSLSLLQVQQYMNSLPKSSIPRFDNGDGIKYRNKQLLLQLPLQDTSPDNCKFLPENSRGIHDQFRREREKAMGTGHVEQAFRTKVSTFPSSIYFFVGVFHLFDRIAYWINFLCLVSTLTFVPRCCLNKTKVSTKEH